MATYDLQEQESLAELKSWWKTNGNVVLTAIAIALLVFAGWNFWNRYQGSQGAQAAVLYEQLQAAARANDAKAVRDTAGSLLEQYPRSAYASLAALIAAKAAYAANDAKTAKLQLQWAVEHARSDQVKAVARLRLAAVALDENAFDEALRAVDGTPPKGFEALFQSMRGDILVAQKKIPEARAAYQAALDAGNGVKAGDKAGEKSGDKPAEAVGDAADPTLRQVLRLKLDALGEN